MAVTIAHVRHGLDETYYVHIVDITGPASYTTGGEALSASDVSTLLPLLGGNLVAADTAKVLVFLSERDTAGRQLVLDRTNSKMMFFDAGAQTANATNLSAVTIRARIGYGGSVGT